MEHDALGGGQGRCTVETLERNLYFCTWTKFLSTELSRCLIRINEQLPPLKTFRVMYFAGLSQPIMEASFDCLLKTILNKQWQNRNRIIDYFIRKTCIFLMFALLQKYS